jgi:signal transduction histidine kinase
LPLPVPLRVLLVEDSDDDSRLVVHELARVGYDVEWRRVETREAMAEALASQAWDLVISDFRMPTFSAPEALALCRERAPDVPFIIVSGTVGEEQAVDSMKAGALDFVVKGRFARLGPAVERGLRHAEERRAWEKAEAQLRQAQKMEAIGQLAGGVAHDFNNILGIITGHCELLLRDLVEPDPRRERATRILSAAERGAALTRQLLAFSRKQLLQPRVLDLNAVVAEARKMLDRLIGEHIQVITVLDPGIPRIKADPGQIEQVILNLALNARDAMPEGGKLIIETAFVELGSLHAPGAGGLASGRQVMLAVSDTGHGMDQETVQRVFEPFFTTKEPGKGTGLGLATVYGIVKQSGGQITVYSEPGRGTTFKVYLRPSAEDVVHAVETVPRQVPSGSETLLLLEDEPSLRAVIRELLEAGGYSVLSGSTPEEALIAAMESERTVDLIVTDVVMPRLGGREAAEQVRRAHPAAKVLYMSGYTDEAIGHHGVLDPATHFLQKPFTAEALLHKVREVLDSGG